ncbi:MAG: chromosome segregation protein SMC [Clostridia bacterium]
MQLKKIEIQGFKSFADKTEILFLDGITTIVGPNGSGKSNISDAVRWVLGEQSVKTLRGSKMEDVIFAGTQARRKVGFAEVSIVLDNSDGVLPIDYNEVVVTRRVYRSGESNYLINNSECRLKDVQELFMDTGIGRDGYSIISQGKIDEILSSKSEERRHIFEEASGIVKYKTRKDEAARKLGNTDTTLIRVNDILTEIENIIGPLEKRANTAKKYLSLRDELKVVDVRIFIESLNKNALNLAKLDEIIETFSEDVALVEQTSVELERAKLNLKEKIVDITMKIDSTKDKYFEIENQTQKLNSRIDLIKSQNDNAVESIERLKSETKEDVGKINLLKEDLENRSKKRQSMKDNKLKFETELIDKQKKLDEMIATLDTRGAYIEELKLSIDSASEQKYQLMVKSSSMSASMDGNQKQLNEKLRAVDKNISGKDSISTTKNDIISSLDKKNATLKNIQEKISNEVLKLNNEKQNRNILEEDKSKKSLELMTLKSKYTYLKNLEQENEGYYKSVKSALDFAKQNSLSDVYGTLASLISTDEKYEYAIEIALGGFLQNIVVESSNTAKKIISHLRQNLLGRVTFLPLDNIRQVNNDTKSKVSKLPGFIAMASNLLKYDKKYESIIALSLNNTAIIDTIENAINISKKVNNTVKLVTLSGELIATTGSMTGGQVSHKSAGLIGRAEKIAEASKKVAEKEKEVLKFSECMEELNLKIEEISNTIQNANQIKDELVIEIATYNEKYQNIKREEEKLENTSKNNTQIIEAIKKENETFDKEIKENDIKVKNIDNQIETKQIEIDEYARFNKEKTQEIDFLNEDVVNLKISLSSFDESVASIDEMRDKISQDILNFETQIEKKTEQVQNLELSINQGMEEIKKQEKEIVRQIGFKKEYRNVSEELKKNKQDYIQKQDILEVKMLESVKQIEKLKDEKSKIESRKIKFDIEIENLKNKMWDEYELTISSAKQLTANMPSIDEKEKKDILKNAERLRKEIKALGEVNISAIEQYQTTKERYDFISTQRQDLEQTKSKLQNLINNMTSIMKQQFSKQFKIINENFNETFKELFGGGKADLRLSDESNILESGIEIEVQPPGKKLQSMMLLSGGERALTATALLFAILKIKSPPFCILDEIEAALDDVNVNRFAEYIKKYSNNTQFIVITHRKGTMEVASCVYGVTMQEYGISKVISMKLKK